MFKLLFQQLLVALSCVFILSACSNGVSVSTSPTVATAAIVNLARTGASRFTSGDGSSTYPYQFHVNANASISYTYTNSGTADATNFYLTTAALPEGWSISANNCGTVDKRITLPVTGVNTCDITFSLDNRISASKLILKGLNQNIITANWTDNSHPNGVSQQALSSITYVNSYLIPDSFINIAQTEDDFGGGDGSKENPFQVKKNGIGDLSFTYTNNGALNATNFYITIDTLPIGWSLNSNSCGTSSNPIILPSNGNNTCNIVFEFSRGEAGVNEFNQNIITAHWSDSANPSGTYSQASSHIRYIRVVSDSSSTSSS